MKAIRYALAKGGYNTGEIKSAGRAGKALTPQVRRRSAPGCLPHIPRDSRFVQKSPPSLILNSIYSINKKRFKLNEEIASKLILQIPKVYMRNQSLLYSVNMISKLSKSEYEILKCIHDGMSYRQIAALRCVEEPSIRVQISRILKKFNKSSTKELMKELNALSFFDIYPEN